MNTVSIFDNLKYNDFKPAIDVLLETDFTKEIRIIFKQNQLMKEHKAPFPIVVEVVSDEIEFGVNGEKLNLTKGSLIALKASVPHDLKAKKDSIVRLTLSKLDKVKRVEYV